MLGIMHYPSSVTLNGIQIPYHLAYVPSVSTDGSLIYFSFSIFIYTFSTWLFFVSQGQCNFSGFNHVTAYMYSFMTPSNDWPSNPGI